MKCFYCKGTGYSGKKPKKCDCVSFCYKCENKEGFRIKINEICDYCSGLGNEKDFFKIIGKK